MGSEMVGLVLLFFISLRFFPKWCAYIITLLGL
jgi:hypothetical protein